jgi:zinc/manganese transport system permease protein
MTLHELLIQPFAEFGFMRRTLVACLCLAVAGAPLGTLLVLRRMSLMGDAMSHALLPGAAIGFAIAGFSMGAMSLGAFVAALSVALLAGWLSRVTDQKEDASFAAFYLIALAAGVMIVSANGSPIDLLHLLFGSALSVDEQALLGVASASSITLILLALIYRPLILECFDPGFLRAAGGPGGPVHLLFLLLVVLNLVAGFLALGTLMSVGLLMLPAITARLWAQDVGTLSATACGISALSALTGLLLSYHLSLPSGPCIVLVAGGIYVTSLLLGLNGSWLSRELALRAHRVA